jgi:hypothetical protein
MGEDEERSYPPSHTVMLTKVLVYASCAGRLLVALDPPPIAPRAGRWQTSRTFARSPIFAPGRTRSARYGGFCASPEIGLFTNYPG